MIGTGQRLYKKAKSLIPGGTQLLSKRPEQHLPDQWPAYYREARGVEVWDLDGNRYIDASLNGIGACVLGAADPDVNHAVQLAVAAGNMSTLNCPEEVELAELLCRLHPWAQMVRYARCGGEAMAMAVRLARAATGRDKVAFCGYHGWHDWYLAANLSEEHALDGHLLPGLAPAGVPRGLLGTSLPFRYNHAEELQAILKANAGEVAAIVMEPVRSTEPAANFLGQVREIATQAGAVFVIDEVTAGFRQNCGGSHMLYHIQPDVAVFAKAMSNGYPMAAILGRADVMQAAQKSFISSTYWTEKIGPVAALATIRKFERCRVEQHLEKIGRRIQDGWMAAAETAGLRVHISGIPALGHFDFEYPNAQAMRTLFTQLMLEKGFLAGAGLYATYAHTDEHVDSYLAAVRDVFARLHLFQEQNRVENELKGPVAHSGFQRLA